MKNHRIRSISLFLSAIIYLVSFLNLFFNLRIFELNTETYHILSIFISSIILWLFVSVEWPSLLAIFSIGIMPSVGFSKAVQLSFGNSTFVFLLFTFIVTYAFNKTGAIRIFTSKLLNSKIAVKSVKNFLLMYLISILLITMFMSPTVVFMFVFPLYEDIVKEFGWKKGDKSASILLFLSFFTIAIATAMTPINHVFSITALSILKSNLGIDFSYITYMLIGIPAGTSIFVISLLGLKFIDYSDTKNLGYYSKKKINKKDKFIVSIFILMILLWILPDAMSIILPSITNINKRYGLVLAPLLATIILLIPNGKNKLLDLNDAFKNGIHWQSLMLVASTLTIGSVISNADIGVTSLINNLFRQIFMNTHGTLIMLLIIIITGILTNFTSNLVTVSLLSTILTSINIDGIKIEFVVAMIGFMSSLAFMSAPSMPYVALSIGSGWINSKDCMKFGSILLLFSVIVVYIATLICVYLF